MCGRIACMLDPTVICQACSYKDPSSNGKHRQPGWKDHPAPKGDGDGSSATRQYYPSANISPTKFTPVMYKVKGPEEEGSVVITPMMFGLVPAYHKGDPKSHGLSTNNARIEGILESRLYKPVLNRRQLCVIVMQGFYEWKTVGAASNKKKQPYLIYAPQEEGVNVADLETWNGGTWSEEDGWKGPKILKVAGLYDVWKSSEGDQVYSYTIITMASNKTLDWLHDRMPAILETEEQVQGWLNANAETELKELMSILKPANSLMWYTVDPKVGNSRCHDTDCIQPMKEVKKENPLAKWLTKSEDGKGAEKRKSTKDDNDNGDEPPEQKPKVE